MERESCPTFERDALRRYKLEKDRIKAHSENFKNLKEKDQFNEFLFCLLTRKAMLKNAGKL